MGYRIRSGFYLEDLVVWRVGKIVFVVVIFRGFEVFVLVYGIF